MTDDNGRSKRLTLMKLLTAVPTCFMNRPTVIRFRKYVSSRVGIWRRQQSYPGHCERSRRIRMKTFCSRTRERAHIDTNMGRYSSPQWCLAISVAEISITAFEDVWEPKANATVSVDEENRKLKYGFLDMAANVDFVSWSPSPLGYNCAFSCPGAEVQR